MAESRRGKTLDLTFTTQKIDNAVSSFNGRSFTTKEIREITGINKNTVNAILAYKTEKGLLQKVRFGCYKKVSDKSLAVFRPSAFVAIKVWEVLSKADRPLTNREISEIIEENIKLKLYFQIGKLLFIWYHRKAIDKIGGKRPYEYQIKPDYNLGRPSAGKQL